MMRVLLVEDELLVRTGMKSLIDWTSHGFVLAAEASHGREALEVLKSQPVDIVITDIRMPVMDGLELIQEIRSLQLPCEIIVLSSFDDFSLVKRAMQLQARDYIHKPTMTPQELMDVLGKISEEIEKKRQSDSMQQMILETVEDSRKLMLERMLRQSLTRTTSGESAIVDVLKGAAILESPYYLAILRILPSKTAETDTPLPSQAEERVLLSVVDEANHSRPSSPIYCFREGELWILFLPDRPSGGIIQDISSRLTGSEKAELLYAMADRPSALEEVHQTYEALNRELEEKYAAWLKLNRLHSLIREALFYIRDNFSENVTLETVSSHIHASPVYLSRLFYKEIGETFIDYLTSYRIKQAKLMLKHSDMKTYEISERVGYKNSKYFLRVFRKLEGMTPGEYRDLSKSK